MTLAPPTDQDLLRFFCNHLVVLCGSAVEIDAKGRACVHLPVRGQRDQRVVFGVDGGHGGFDYRLAVAYANGCFML